MMDYLNQSEHAQLQALRLTNPLVDGTLREFDRISSSPQFARAHKAQGFLGIALAWKLLGREHEIKEATIGDRLWPEPAGYDPAQTSRGRGVGRTVRRRLPEYYSRDGQDDPIEISMRAGTFVPEIRDRRVSIAVTRFEDWNPRGNQGHFCDMISDEIASRLNKVPRVRAIRVPALEMGNNAPRYGLRGSLEFRADAVRLNVSLSDLSTSEILFSRVFEGWRDDLLRLCGQAVEAVFTALKPETRYVDRGKLELPPSATGFEKNRPRHSQI
jgi:TolB-like protein